jgi:hypothetical protein
MKHKGKKHFQQKTMRLKDNHTWKAPDGYKILVIDRGAASFNFPASWILAKLEPAVEIHDAAPPNDNARLMVTIMKMPPGIDWTGLPLVGLLAQSIKGSQHEILKHGEIVKAERSDLELVWVEQLFLDPIEKREAYSRIALARGWNVHVLITFDFWENQSEKYRPVWDEVLRSLQLGRQIEDPTKGATLH